MKLWRPEFVHFGYVPSHNPRSYEGLAEAKGLAPDLELKGDFGQWFWARVTWRTQLAYKDPHRLGFTCREYERGLWHMKFWVQ